MSRVFDASRQNRKSQILVLREPLGDTAHAIKTVERPIASTTWRKHDGRAIETPVPARN